MQWTRRVWILLAVQFIVTAGLVTVVEVFGPSGENGPWDELGGFLVAVPIFAMIWPLRFDAAEGRAFMFTFGGSAGLAWVALKLF